jgi:glycosyltransferase involved in cell wall biosynthesis
VKLVFCLEYPLAQQGGTEVVVTELIRRLAAKQHRIWLVSADDTVSLARSRPAALLDGHIPSPRFSTWFGRGSKALAGKIAAVKPDLVHFHFSGNYGWNNRIVGQSPIRFLTAQGIPCLSTVHLIASLLDGFCGPEKPLWLKIGLLPAAWLGKMSALRDLKAEIAVSEHDEHLLRRWYFPLKSKFHRIYHSRVDDLPTGPYQREKIILSVGHLAIRKGQHVLVRAFAKLANKYPDWKLVVIGHVGDESCVRDINDAIAAHSLFDRVQLLGSQENAVEWMRRAEIFVQPSLLEALGLALQEALLCGCACIGTRIGGIPELIDNEVNGLLVRSNNVDELVQALDRLLASADFRDALAREAPGSILRKKMTAEHMMAEHLKLYQSILDAH